MIIAGAGALRSLSMANCHLTDTFGVQFAEALKTNRYLEKFNFYVFETCPKRVKTRTQNRFKAVVKPNQSTLVVCEVDKLDVSIQFPASLEQI